MRHKPFKGVAKKGRKRLRGYWSPESWANQKRPRGYRLEQGCKFKDEHGVQCDRPHGARGYCQKHYASEWRRKLDPIRKSRKRHKTLKVVYLKAEVAMMYHFASWLRQKLFPGPQAVQAMVALDTRRGGVL